MVTPMVKPLNLSMHTISPGCGKISQNQCSYFVFQLYPSFAPFICSLFCLLYYFAHIVTMAESLQGIRALPMGDIQSILEGESEDDSQHSLPQVPDTTVDTTGLSSIHQNLSSSFSHLQRGLASHIGSHIIL